jgi:hypothetical protein
MDSINKRQGKEVQSDALVHEWLSSFTPKIYKQKSPYA